MTLRYSTPGQDEPATTCDPNAALKQILAINPKASLHEIRSFHPALKAMSYDHLGLRVSRIIDAARFDAA